MTSRAQGHKWLTLAAMCFGLFLIMLDNTIVNVALPSIQRELDASPSQLESWFTSSAHDAAALDHTVDAAVDAFRMLK